MPKLLFFVSIVFLTTFQCTLHPSVQSKAIEKDSTLQLLELIDYSRNRSIPVALYLPDSDAIKETLIVFNHGYGENQPGSYLGYSYLNRFLAQQGYLVASIQHELPGDDPLPMEGNLREARMPNWENGVLNILFVAKELKNRNPYINEKKITVIGHSNGGDMAMLYASSYPLKTVKAISLDNLRMPLPLIDSLKIYSLRSNDKQPDKGVLPSPEQQQKHGIGIVYLPNTRHIEMTDALASPKQKEEICRYVLKFLKEK